jgi:hypothetical protein
LEITVSFLGIHKREPDIYIGFSPALYLQCGSTKVVFDKTAFVKFKISNNFKQNIDETHSKQPKIRRKIHTNLKVSKEKKSWDFCQMFVISEKKTIPYRV